MIDHVIRPFLTGVFLEPHLMTSRRFMDVVLASFMKGTPSLPQPGMQAIPDQLHDALPDGTVHCESPVRRLTPASVETDSGTITASVVIVATDATHASALLEDAGLTTELNTATNSVTTWYHAVATTAAAATLLIPRMNQMLRLICRFRLS